VLASLKLLSRPVFFQRVVFSDTGCKCQKLIDAEYLQVGLLGSVGMTSGMDHNLHKTEINLKEFDIGMFMEILKIRDV
jgi:hypothetical protein